MKNPSMSRPLYEVDPQIANAVDNKARRQHEGLELIASENLPARRRLNRFLTSTNTFVFNEMDE